MKLLTKQSFGLLRRRTCQACYNELGNVVDKEYSKDDKVVNQENIDGNFTILSERSDFFLSNLYQLNYFICDFRF